MINLLKHPVVALLITIFAVLYYLSLDSSAQKATVSSNTVEELEQEVNQMSNEVAVLEKKLDTANHPVTQEKVIRNELLLQKPGEYVLQLPPIEVEETPSPTVEKKTPWEEWQTVLF